ncbi:MAG TPA: TetR family transcriptional regulator [Intrasporangium sp.]|uniref:TetR/AcrR family transcriptional regulator n=1 Tax=Intrasporangium sp. TaxID=1925024 RepID=UPI002D7883D6|nr:TetR family transcriptional regulator [Intrasporangium sp.]HET7398885.1 TetR family transcriptional regulator [Intrasporangium sp.]
MTSGEGRGGAAPTGASRTGTRGRGRRAGGGDTRAAIVAAARAQFARHGYDKATLRGIAREAGVDPSLVHHYFSGKAGLFAQTLDVPVDPGAVIDAVLAPGLDRVGWRIVEAFLGVWDAPGRRESFVALLRSSMTSDEGARVLREFLVREVFGRVTAAAGVPDAALRASLAASQVLGMAVLRYVLKVPALVEASDAEIVERLGPVLQRHLVDDVPRRD